MIVRALTFLRLADFARCYVYLYFQLAFYFHVKAVGTRVSGGTDQNQNKSASTKEYHFDIDLFRENMSIEHTVNNGLITDWEGMEKLWLHGISHYMNVDTRETPVLFTEKPYHPPNSRHK